MLLVGRQEGHPAFWKSGSSDSKKFTVGEPAELLAVQQKPKVAMREIWRGWRQWLLLRAVNWWLMNDERKLMSDWSSAAPARILIDASRHPPATIARAAATQHAPVISIITAGQHLAVTSLARPTGWRNATLPVPHPPIFTAHSVTHYL